MSATWSECSVDRRSPFCESRRKTDIFPDGGAFMITLFCFTVISFALGLALGAWIW